MRTMRRSRATARALDGAVGGGDDGRTPTVGDVHAVMKLPKPSSSTGEKRWPKSELILPGAGQPKGVARTNFPLRARWMVSCWTLAKAKGRSFAQRLKAAAHDVGIGGGRGGQAAKQVEAVGERRPAGADAARLRGTGFRARPEAS